MKATEFMERAEGCAACGRVWEVEIAQPVRWVTSGHTPQSRKVCRRHIAETCYLLAGPPANHQLLEFRDRTSRYPSSPTSTSPSSPASSTRTAARAATTSTKAPGQGARAV